MPLLRKPLVLNIILFTTSAAIAVILPPKKIKPNDKLANGKLQLASRSCGGGYEPTCITAASQQNCNETTSHGINAPSCTSAPGECSSDTEGLKNTSIDS
jgi:hypothetical protein